ncbi:hypothetical protein L553_2092 [Bordetella pertussis I036]|nr:hypothetical protein L548_2333 [Bordetella pertussis H921]ETH54438.1 hypothetical protein L552_2062 [Bordetella pertussis I002]ETH58391.1 hypothetical protein L553_2092 [Bordetella pertussis I036]ETH68311.1 hypothetical protein L567_2121 [Bordetella pertussis STO1-CHLA-0006]ETH82275.1 hypothetical protein L559_2311 [Bordetella pertussis STO1-CHOC-0017]ETH85563.1 hypothetical protein L560_2435 [Bordetella pertussis STO1-CHOC-0018]ETH99164.1 hypothetical protein L556_2292 [Bordetella pertuss
MREMVGNCTAIRHWPAHENPANPHAPSRRQAATTYLLVS